MHRGASSARADRTAIDVDDICGQVELFHHCKRLGREGPVDFDPVQFVQRPARAFDSLPDGRYRPMPNISGATAATTKAAIRTSASSQRSSANDREATIIAAPLL
jgi:hypothetical protein